MSDRHITLSPSFLPYMAFILAVLGNFKGIHNDDFAYTRIYSTSLDIPLESLLGEYVLCHEILPIKLLFPKISSQISFRLACSLSSMEMKIAPSSASSFCSSRSRGYIMQSHLSWRDRSSPSFPTTSPSHFLIRGSFTLSLYTHPSLPVL